jgi:hypothetical protein
MAIRRIGKIVSMAAELLAITLFSGPTYAANPVSSAQDIVAAHLDSIGDLKSRAGVKTRVAQGTARFRIPSGGAGTLDGKLIMVSEGKELQFMMKFPNNEYRGEQFIFNGDRVQVSFATQAQSRSAFGGFVYIQDAMLKEGLWGGVLSTAWPLLDIEHRKPKLNYEGLKDIAGEKLYGLRYEPKKATDLEIHLYFDPENFHHVRTVYTMSVGFTTVPGEVGSARQQATRYRLEERFSDFKTTDGFTLPTRYNIQFTPELQSGGSNVSEWDIRDIQSKSNVALDPKNFEVK